MASEKETNGNRLGTSVETANSLSLFSPHPTEYTVLQTLVFSGPRIRVFTVHVHRRRPITRHKNRDRYAYISCRIGYKKESKGVRARVCVASRHRQRPRWHARLKREGRRAARPAARGPRPSRRLGRVGVPPCALALPLRRPLCRSRPSSPLPLPLLQLCSPSLSLCAALSLSLSLSSLSSLPLRLRLLGSARGTSPPSELRAQSVKGEASPRKRANGP